MNNPEKVVIEAKKKGMQAIICSIPDQEDIGKVLHLKDKYPEFFFLCLGFHPHGLEKYTNEQIDEYLLQIESQRYDIVGIGEIGLEYTEDLKHDKERQIIIFEKFIELAKKLNLPILIHIRDAYEDAFTVLEKHKLRDVVLHCFSGSETDLKRALSNGYWISFATNVCYTKKHPRLAALTPLDRMLLETDSPWLDPANPRERTNRPWNIEKSAEVIAKLHGKTKEDVLIRTTQNAKKVFGV